MDVVQKVMALTHKVDALYQMIEQLDSKVTGALGETQANSSHSGNSSSLRETKQDLYPYYSPLDSVMEHKDVLVDGGRESLTSRSSSEKDLSTEIQIQRLTAQLTAAYNRIAALEEQLLARRAY